HARIAVTVAEMREAEIDRDAALALFLQAVGVDTGERLDQRRLAVIDVPRCTEDDVHSRYGFPLPPQGEGIRSRSNAIRRADRNSGAISSPHPDPLPEGEGTKSGACVMQRKSSKNRSSLTRPMIGGSFGGKRGPDGKRQKTA